MATACRGHRMCGWARRAVRLVVSLGAAIPFYLFRIVHTRWGDAYILVNSIAHPGVYLTYSWQAPLDVYLHARLWAAGNRLFGWQDAMPAYWLLSIAAGVVFVWVTLDLALRLGQNRTQRVLFAGLVLTLGTMQLFFGYVENYTLMTLGVLIYAWLAVRVLHGELSPVWPAAALALTHAFHPSTLVLAPSLLYLAWACRAAPPLYAADGSRPPARARPARSYATTAAMIAVPYVLVGLGVLALMSAGGHGIQALFGSDAPGGADRSWFVPLFRASSQWEHYTMFSAGHLLDTVNEQLLVGPMLLPGLALAALFGWRGVAGNLCSARQDRREFLFLVLLAASYLLLTLVWNPDYGGQRDWDLFSPAAVPVALLLGRVLVRALPEKEALREAAWTVLAAQAFHTITWIYQNTRPWSWS